mmetsp:Transcript_13780/g.24409  ORF Transcript_13780/g.24409 Transcript_13780/m.24409 type:complete len:223 (-) Transcript_13780:301-969(-)
MIASIIAVDDLSSDSCAGRIHRASMWKDGSLRPKPPATPHVLIGLSEGARRPRSVQTDDDTETAQDSGAREQHYARGARVGGEARRSRLEDGGGRVDGLQPAPHRPRTKHSQDHVHRVVVALHHIPGRRLQQPECQQGEAACVATVVRVEHEQRSSPEAAVSAEDEVVAASRTGDMAEGISDDLPHGLWNRRELPPVASWPWAGKDGSHEACAAQEPAGGNG